MENLSGPEWKREHIWQTVVSFDGRSSVREVNIWERPGCVDLEADMDEYARTLLFNELFTT